MGFGGKGKGGFGGYGNMWGVPKGGWVYGYMGKNGGFYKGWGGKGFSKGGDGKGGGGGSYQQREISGVVDESFVVDPNAVYTGTVTVYYKFNGYGFIELDQKGVAPNDKVFVYWTEVKSSDRYPTLNKDMQVVLSLKKEEKRGKMAIAAANVANVDGTIVSLQDELDTKKTFVGSQNLRYSGVCKFFAPKRGYGYVTIDEGYTFDNEPVPNEIRVELTEVNASGGKPGYIKGEQVEFGIWKTPRGHYKAYNMTRARGEPFPPDMPVDPPPSPAPAA